jgi:DNA repair exonuclease SbcCD ATPase subunit
MECQMRLNDVLSAERLRSRELERQRDEARSEVMRLQDNDSAYALGYQRADAAAGAVIERLRQERDEARARLAAAEAERDQAVEALDEQIRRLQVAIERAREFPCPECGHRLVVACTHDVSQAAEPAPAAPTAGGEGHDDD